MTMKTFFTLHITSCEKHRMDWCLRRVVLTAAVTTHAKPHAQQQLARDLQVERGKVPSAARVACIARSACTSLDQSSNK